MSYTPLDTDKNLIRLLHLHPASSQDDAIKCDFTLALLDDKPDYEALSYVWGDATDTRPIEVEGKTDVPITINLFAALKHLRFEDRERILWVDALCINQKDFKERMHQVSKMASIFGQATRVVAWLGKSWDGSEMAFESLRKSADDKSLHINPLMEPNLSVNGLSFDSSKLRWNIIRFFNLQWWKRTWTVQECILAQDLIFRCSQDEIDGISVLNALNNYVYHRSSQCCMNMEDDDPHPTLGKSIRESLTEPLNLLAQSYGRSYSLNLLENIAYFSSREVTDPRDKIFGMLALGAGPYTDLVQADYTLSPKQVCEAVVINSVHQTQKLDFLSHLRKERDQKWPSFLPNWTGSAEWNNELMGRLVSNQSFNSCLNHPAGLRYVSRGMMAFSGVMFDTIATTSGEPVRHPYMASTLQSWKELHTIAGISSETKRLYARTNDPSLLAFWDSLCGGVEFPLADSGKYFQRITSSTDLSNYFKWEEYITSNEERKNEMWNTELALLWTAIDSASQGRRFFNTEKGHFGWAPQDCKVGDLVVVLAGGNVPYIIRPVSCTKRLRKLVSHAVKDSKFWTNGGKTVKPYLGECYTILGDSYVHGIMDGEVFSILDESERQLRDIVLV